MSGRWLLINESKSMNRYGSCIHSNIALCAPSIHVTRLLTALSLAVAFIFSQPVTAFFHYPYLSSNTYNLDLISSLRIIR